jgi:hypothetical protein
MPLVLWRLLTLASGGDEHGPILLSSDGDVGPRVLGADTLDADDELWRALLPVRERRRRHRCFGHYRSGHSLLSGPQEVSFILFHDRWRSVDGNRAAVWFTFVAPMNAIMATWTPNPVPTEFISIRNQWEYSHAIIALIKIGGLSALLISVLIDTRRS